MDAFEAAINQGTQGIELDIRQCADGTLVCVHDSFINGQQIHSLHYDELLANAKASGHIPPNLQDVLATFGGQIHFDLEIKHAGYESEVVQLAQRFMGYEQYVITSFEDEVLQTVKRLDSNIRVGLILGVKHPKPWLSVRWSELFPKQRLQSAGADFVVPHFKLLKFGFLNRMAKGGWPVWVWTVNEERRIRSLLHQEQIECIITDNTQFALRVRAEQTA